MHARSSLACNKSSIPSPVDRDQRSEPKTRRISHLRSSPRRQHSAACRRAGSIQSRPSWQLPISSRLASACAPPAGAIFPSLKGTAEDFGFLKPRSPSRSSLSPVDRSLARPSRTATCPDISSLACSPAPSIGRLHHKPAGSALGLPCAAFDHHSSTSPHPAHGVRAWASWSTS